MAAQNHTQVAPSAIEISHIVIRQDAEGRYCLNDLHKAAGGEKRHQPSDWLRLQQTKDLLAEIENEIPGIPGIKIIKGHRVTGTYVVKELVYAYAMWISASFHLKVIRAYDAQQNQLLEKVEQLPKHSLPVEAFQTKLLVCIDKGEVSQQVVLYGSCVVDPNDPVSVATFIRECVPSTPQMLSAISSGYITKLMNCQDAAINSLNKRDKQ